MEQSVFENQLNINEEIRSYLKQTSNWTFFLSVVGFIMTALIMFGGVMILALSGSMPNETIYGEMGMSFSTIGLIYLISGGIMLLPTIYLFNFSRKTKDALTSSRMDTFASGFSNLKNYFKFLGIITIIYIVLFIAMMMFIMSMGASAMSSSSGF